MTAPSMLRAALAAAALSAAALPAAAGDPPINLDDQAQIAAGQATFNHTCAGYCHGRDGLQGKGPSLRGRDDLAATEIHNTIANGRRNTGKLMPAWKGQLDDEQIWQLTAFILSLRSEH